eukprot:gene8976-biopygen15213
MACLAAEVWLCQEFSQRPTCGKNAAELRRHAMSVFWPHECAVGNGCGPDAGVAVSPSARTGGTGPFYLGQMLSTTYIVLYSLCQTDMGINQASGDGGAAPDWSVGTRTSVYARDLAAWAGFVQEIWSRVGGAACSEHFLLYWMGLRGLCRSRVCPQRSTTQWARHAPPAWCERMHRMCARVPRE